MALIQSPDKFSQAQNISKMQGSGRSHAQSVAIAISESKKANGGVTPFKPGFGRKRYGSSISKIPKID